MKTTEKIYPRIFDKSDLLTIPKAHPVSSASRGKGRSKYRVRLNIGYKSILGDPVLKSFYAPSAAEAKQRAYQYIQSMLDSQLQEKEINSLLVTAIEQYLYTERFGRKKPGTFDRLEEIFRHQIAPYIQGLRTENTTKADCAAIIDNNLQAGYSYSVLVKTYQLLKAFFRYYCDEHPDLRNPMRNYQLYSKEHVLAQQAKLRSARDIALEKHASGKGLTAEEADLVANKLKMQDTVSVKLLSDDEIVQIQKTIEAGYNISWTSKNGKEIRTKSRPFAQGQLILFLLYTGLRNGELRALRYADVDFEEGTISIAQTRSVGKKRGKDNQVTGGLFYDDGSPKTRSSVRVLPLSDQALTCLIRLKVQEPDGYNGYIANAGGKPLTHAVLFRRYQTVLRHAGIPHGELHDLRRTFATKLYRFTGDQVLVDNYLGHASRTVTEKYYLGNQLAANRDLIRQFVI